MEETKVNYNVGNLYQVAFPDLASRAIGRLANGAVTELDGARDLGLRKGEEALDSIHPALGNAYHVDTQRRPGPVLDFQGINAVHLVQGEELSVLGTPIFQPVTFLGGKLLTLGAGNQQGQVVEDDFVSWRLPATTTAEFKRSKVITKSHPSTANGTTKELWAFDDWDVTIRGLILDAQPDYFPTGELRQLLRWEKVVDSVEVAGDMFTYLGIRRLVIESLSIGRVAGQPNTIPFQMSCVSDEPLELSVLTLNAMKR
jgi:hypothetical protein